MASEHTFPVPQPVPSGSPDQSVVDWTESHVRQGFPGSAVPCATTAPEMKHADVQVPLLQICASPQDVPFWSGLQAVVETSGAHVWQVPFMVPAARY